MVQHKFRQVPTQDQGHCKERKMEGRGRGEEERRGEEGGRGEGVPWLPALLTLVGLHSGLWALLLLRGRVSAAPPATSVAAPSAAPSAALLLLLVLFLRSIRIPRVCW